VPITRVQILSVPVSDQDRSLEFYVGVLGFELLRDDPMGPEMRWVQIAPKGAQTTIVLVTWFDTMAPGSLKGLLLETDSLEEDIERLRGASVEVGAIQQEAWGRYVMFDDPDGNGVILRGAGSEAWA
jgi:catechol 2,3-dioxygenase-like lactoylglutathione lyase family enzyme